MVECFIFKYRFYSSGVVRPTDQEMTAIENKVHYSRFPRGGLQTTPCRATWGEAPMGGGQEADGASRRPRAFQVASVGKGRRDRASKILKFE